MKKQLITILLLSLCATVCVAKEKVVSLDKIVAIVNDDVVTQSELQHAINVNTVQLTQNHVPLPTDEQMRSKTLDQLIDKKLQLQLAKQSGLIVTTEELDKIIEHIAQQNQMSVSSLYDHIQQTGISPQSYKQDIREQLLLQKIEQQQIPPIAVSANEINQFLKSQSWQPQNNLDYHLEDILVPIPDRATPSDLVEAKKRALIILSKLKQGLSIDDAAKLSSYTQTQTVQNGDLGWRKASEIPSVFAQPLATMKVHDIVGPIQAPNGFHLIRLLATRNDSSAQIAPSRDQIRMVLLQRKFERAVESWVLKLRDQAFIVTNPDKQ